MDFTSCEAIFVLYDVLEIALYAMIAGMFQVHLSVMLHLMFCSLWRILCAPCLCYQQT